MSDKSPTGDRVFIPFGGQGVYTAAASSRGARSFAARHGKRKNRKEREKRLENFLLVTTESFKGDKKNPKFISVGHSSLTNHCPRQAPNAQPSFLADPNADQVSESEDQLITEPDYSSTLAYPSLSSPQPLAGNPDPFDSLPIPAARLLTLMSNPEANLAGEPVFSINVRDPLRSIAAVFPSNGLMDEAVCTGLALNISFAANHWQWNVECICYMNDLVRSINRKVASARTATEEITIGAVLLLVSIEKRNGNRSAIEWHMNGIVRILQLRNSLTASLSPGIKRALFWQDLTSTELIGTPRLFGLQTFPDTFGTKSQLVGSTIQLASGFERIREILSVDIESVLEDLQSVSRDVCDYLDIHEDMQMLTKIRLDDQQAWIESRLVDLQPEARKLGLITECIRLAAFVCTYFLDVSSWSSNFVPSHLSKHLLLHLQETLTFCFWDTHIDLLLWLVTMGFYAAPTEMVPQYQHFKDTLSVSLPQIASMLITDLRGMVTSFIWPRNAPISIIEDIWQCTSL